MIYLLKHFDVNDFSENPIRDYLKPRIFGLAGNYVAPTQFLTVRKNIVKL